MIYFHILYDSQTCLESPKFEGLFQHIKGHQNGQNMLKLTFPVVNNLENIGM